MILSEAVVGDWRHKTIRAKKGASLNLFKRLMDYTMSSVVPTIAPMLEPAAEVDAPGRSFDQMDAFAAGTVGWVRSLVDSSRSYVVNLGMAGTDVILFFKTVVSGRDRPLSVLSVAVHLVADTCCA
jgi:hypothetical protein